MEFCDCVIIRRKNNHLLAKSFAPHINPQWDVAVGPDNVFDAVVGGEGLELSDGEGRAEHILAVVAEVGGALVDFACVVVFEIPLHLVEFEFVGFESIGAERRRSDHQEVVVADCAAGAENG